VGVAVVPAGAGRLAVTITASQDPGNPTNELFQLRFTTDPRIPSTNAMVEPWNITGAYVANVSGVSTTFWLRQLTPGQPVTVPLTVVDTCGSWPTVVGGGAELFGSGSLAAASPVPTASRTPAPASGAATPTPLAQCAPRPAIAVVTSPLGSGRLQVTVTAPTAANDRLVALRFGTATNARIEAGTQSGTGEFTVPLAPGTQQASFTLSRVTAGQAASVPVTVVDSCGEWPTVVGGGPAAF
jgi:hypothetical protein